jgi:hypothetical protein
VIEVNGCYGTVLWSVNQQLFAMLPRQDRETVLDITGQDVIGPFFERTTNRLLYQVGYTGPPSSGFCTDSSLETVESGCLRTGNLADQPGPVGCHPRRPTECTAGDGD